MRNKNLIPYPYAETTKTINGITFTDNGDGTITANGTATANVNYELQHNNTMFSLPAGNYFLSGCPAGGSTTTYFMATVNGAGISYDKFIRDFGNGVTVSSKGEKWKVSIRIMSGTTVNNLVFKLQLELGSTATAYTPYISDLTSVNVTACGKNLFDKDNANIIAGYIDANVIMAAHTSRCIYIPCNPNTTYTVSKIATARFAVAFTNVIPTAGTAVTNQVQNFTATSITATSGADSKYIVVWLYNSVYDTTTTIDEILATVQIELGSTATEYEPYKMPIEYTPAADGTVSGVKSLYPTTTLITDTEGAIIEAEYNRDINKAFAELQQAIISLGGNV